LNTPQEAPGTQLTCLLRYTSTASRYARALGYPQYSFIIAVPMNRVND